MRIEAPTLEEALNKAAIELGCSVLELDYKVVQNPKNGFLGFGKQNAVIEASIDKKDDLEELINAAKIPPRVGNGASGGERKGDKFAGGFGAGSGSGSSGAGGAGGAGGVGDEKGKNANLKGKFENRQESSQEKRQERANFGKNKNSERFGESFGDRFDSSSEFGETKTKSNLERSFEKAFDESYSRSFEKFEKFNKRSEKSEKQKRKKQKDTPKFELDKFGFMDEKEPERESKREPKEHKKVEITEPKNYSKLKFDNAIFDSFHKETFDNEVKSEQNENGSAGVDGGNKGGKSGTKEIAQKSTVSQETLDAIRAGMQELIQTSGYKVNLKEVSTIGTNEVYIAIEGAEVPLLIGKDGYRYEAFSLMLFSWVNAKFGVNLKLEIGEFIKQKENAMAQYLDQLIDVVNRHGKCQTKMLDNISLRIGLEKLRMEFPNKYVAIKSVENERCIVVGDFKKK